MRHFYPISQYSLDETIGVNPTEVLRCSDEMLLLEDKRGRIFLLAVESGNFAEVSPEASDWIRARRGNTSSEEYDVDGGGIADEYVALAATGFFRPRIKREASFVNSVNLNIRKDCNLRCRYCFAGSPRHASDSGSMQRDLLRSVIEKAVEATPKGRSIRFVLFGGEPLLDEDLVFFAIDTAGELEKSAGVTIGIDVFTNGLCISESMLVRFKNDRRVRMLVSMDGPPHINDAFRPAKSGIGVSGKVTENLSRLLVADPTRVVVRSTIASVPARLVERAEYFISLGARNIVFESAYCNDSDEIAAAVDIIGAMEDELWDLSGLLRREIARGAKVNISPLSSIISTILRNQLGAAAIDSSGCPAGKSYISVDVNGDLYPCHYLNRVEAFKMGNIAADGIIRKPALEENGERALGKDREPCCSCAFRNVCSGLCAFKELVHTGGPKTQAASCSLFMSGIMVGLELLADHYRSGKYPFIKEFSRRVNASMRNDRTCR